MNIATKSIHSGYSSDPTTKAVVPPIYQTSPIRLIMLNTARSFFHFKPRGIFTAAS